MVDDVPSAAGDADAIAAGAYGPAVGNVITDAELDGGKDTTGADGATLVAISGVAAGAVGGTTQGLYGVLTIDSAGNYSYVRSAGTPGGVQDTFSYTIRDGDGDVASANLVITIGDSPTSLNLPVAGTPGVTQVLEEGLPTGSAAATNGEFASGTFTFSAPDGPATITIGGTALTGGVQQFTGAHGTLTINSVVGNTVSYSYQLTSNTSGEGTFDSFAVVVADKDNESSSGNLVISIVDDVPTARADVDSVTEDLATVANGNVLTGAAVASPDANGTDGVADVQGADGASVTAVSFVPASGPVVAGTVGSALSGAYGSLTLAAGGGYTYTLNNSNPIVQGLDGNDTLTETFRYTITDGDGDPSATTLVVTINGNNDPITITGLDGEGAEETVYEANLSDGSAPLAGALTQTGTFEVTGTDGIATIVVGGDTVFTGGAFVPGQTVTTAYGTLTITGVTPVTDAAGDVVSATVAYSYVLQDNTLLHSVAGNDVSLTETIAVSVTDSDGSTDTASLDITVVDDVPLAVNDGTFTVAEQMALTINALSNDTFGADGVSYTTGVTLGTLPTKGTVTYNSATHQFTYTPTPGASGADSFTYTITDADGDPSTATVSLMLAEDSVPNILGTTNLAVDEDGLPGANADANPLQGAPAEVAGTGLASATGTATVNFGADVPANLAASIILLDTAGLDTQIKTLDGTFVTFALESGALVGRSGGTEVIRIAVTDADAGTNPGDVVYTYTVTLSQPVQHATAGTEDTIPLNGISFRVTDSDNSQATGTFNVTVRDDVPSIDVAKGADGAVVLTTRDAYTDGTPTNEDTAASTANFSSVFSSSSTVGADGQASQSLTYALNVTGPASGLTSHGAAITLYKLASGVIVGTTAASMPTTATDASVVFSIAVSAGGVMTVTQYQQVDHDLPGAAASPYDTQFEPLGDGLVTLTATGTITDRDGDVATDSETVDLGGNIRFADDGPSFSGVSAGGSVSLDETTAASPAGFGVAGISATSAAAMINATAAFGADGQAASGALVYGLAITGGGATPLRTAIGDFAISLVQVDGDTVEGRYTDGTVKVAFRLDILGDGKVTVTQFVPLEHLVDGATAADHNDPLTLTDALGTSLLTATVTAKDFDGDTANTSVAIGGNITFRDDGPDAVADTDSIAAGSNGPAVGNVISGVGTLNNGVDYGGADGAFISSVTGSVGATAIASSGDTVVQGQYGVLTINALGAYSYARTPGLGGGETETFTYTLTDNDGDSDTATLAISIGDLTPTATTASAAVDDEGLTGGIAGVLANGDIDANSGDLDATSEAIFRGVLGATLGDGTNTFLFQSTLNTTTQVIGQETVTYTVSGDGSLLTAKITTSADGDRVDTNLFTVQITNQATGAYTVTLLNNVLHPAAANENNVDITIPYQLRDADSDFSVVAGTLSVRLNDDVPVVLNSGNATISGSNLSGSGAFSYGIGADGRTSWDSAHTDLAVTLTGAVGGTAILSPSVTWFSETDLEAVFNFTFQYDSDPTRTTDPLVNETGKITFDKDAGTYTVTLDQAILSYSTSQTSNVVGTRTEYNLDGQPQAEVVVAQLAGSDPVFVQSSGGAGNLTAGVTLPGAFVAGELFSADQSYVTVSNTSNGVSGDTIQGQGDEVFDFDLFSSDPGSNLATTTNAVGAIGLTMKLFGVNNGDDYIVVLKLADASDPSTVLTTKAMVISSGDVYSTTASIPAGYAQTLGNQESLIIIESNDFNSDTDANGTANYVIVGAQLLASSGGITGSGINLNGAVGDAGASSGTLAFDDDNEVIKVNDIGIIRTVTNTQALTLDFAVTVTDADGDATTTSHLLVNPVPPVVVDLDGDGAEFLALSAGVTYDYFGQSVATAWAGADDGILAIDLNHDGKVSSSAEFVFGGNGLTDLQGVAAQHDSNHDGVLDAADQAFASFGVWRDANSNGVADEGEYRSLTELGIKSINLASDGKAYTAADGDVTVAGTTTVTFVNGTTTTAADASFEIARLSQQVEGAITAAAASSLVAASLAAVVVTTDAPVALAVETTVDVASASETTLAEPDGSVPPVDFAQIADHVAAVVPEAAHAVQHLAEILAHFGGSEEASDASEVASDLGGSGYGAGLAHAGAIVFDAPESVQAMDALLVAAANVEEQAPQVAGEAAIAIQQALADGHAANFVDSLIDGVLGAGDAGTSHSVDLAALLGAQVGSGGQDAGIPPMAFDFAQAAMEMAAVSHA